MTASSSIRSSSCVGMTSVPLGPVGMKCHESLLYVAAGSSVTAVDLRTMQKAFMVSQQTKVHSFEFLPTKSALCTGGTGRAMLWDVRRVSEPTVELDGHVGPIKHVLMDSFKIVTGGPDDPYVNVWEADTGKQTNSLVACASDRPQTESGCSAIAVDGYRIVTAGGVDQETATLCIRDFRTATCYVSPDASQESPSFSKFWDSGSDSEEVDWQ